MVEVPHLVSIRLAVRANYLGGIKPDGSTFCESFVCGEDAVSEETVVSISSSKSSMLLRGGSVMQGGRGLY